MTNLKKENNAKYHVNVMIAHEIFYRVVDYSYYGKVA